MPDLAGSTFRPAVEPTFHHDPGADAFSDGDDDEVVHAVAPAEPLLCHREGVHVVVDQHGPTEPLRDRAGNRDFPPTEGGGVPAHSGVGINQAGQPDADAYDLVQLDAGGMDGVLDCACTGLPARRLVPRRPGPARPPGSRPPQPRRSVTATEMTWRISFTPTT